MALSKPEITARCLEISNGLSTLVNDQAVYIEQHLENTSGVGTLARLAARLHQQDSLDTTRLGLIAGALRIGWPQMTQALDGLEALGWGTVRREGKRIQSFDERIPSIQTVVTQLGAAWGENQPTEHDVGSVHGLELLSNQPATKERFVGELGLKTEIADDVIAYGEAATYFSQSEGLLWSPLFWHNREDLVQRFLKRNPEGDFGKLGSISKTLRERPGTPVKLLEQGALMASAIDVGFVPTVTVGRLGKERQYAFAPSPAFGTQEGADLFEKARMIVGALRHGQHEAEKTPIKYPRLVLRAIRDGTMTPHSDAPGQYGGLFAEGIVELDRVAGYSSSRYRARMIDTPENKKGFDLAEQMLSPDQDALAALSDPDYRLLFGTPLMAGAAYARYEKRRSSIQAVSAYQQMLRAIKGNTLE